MEDSNIENNLDEIKKWVRIIGIKSLGVVLEEFSREELIIYNEADGETSISDIANAASVSTGFASGRFQDWREMKIVEKDGRQWKHIAPLSVIGIQIPEETNE